VAIETARVAFAGTPDFAVPTLKALIAGGVPVSMVLTQPDRRAGRGRSLKPSAVRQAADDTGLPVLQPERLDDAFRRRLDSERRPDLLIVVAYGLLLPAWMLEWPRVAPVNVHASLLPRWRGASPIQQAILAGDDETGISIMRMTRGLDTGPVWRQARIPVGKAETAGELHDRLATLGAETLVETLSGILDGTLDARPQDETGASYAPRIEKRDAVIDWTDPAIVIERRIRAFNPWPVAETTTATGQRLRIWAAEAKPGSVADLPGTVVAAGDGVLEVATGDGLIRIRRLQPPGGRAMSAAAYLAAHDLKGTVFVGP
jgi:methionyl-tRNA formyltransferase